MDDVLTGAETFEDARRIKENLKSMIQVGFELTKWKRNFKLLGEKGGIQTFATNQITTVSKTLGISWDYSVDMFYYEIPRALANI